MYFHYLDLLLILDAVFGLYSEPFKTIKNIFPATLNYLLNQKFHSVQFSIVGPVNKEGLPITKAYLLVPFSYFRPSVFAISVSIFGVYPILLFCCWLFFPFHFTCRLAKVKCFSLLLLTPLALSV